MLAPGWLEEVARLLVDDEEPVTAPVLPVESMGLEEGVVKVSELVPERLVG